MPLVSKRRALCRLLCLVGRCAEWRGRHERTLGSSSAICTCVLIRGQLSAWDHRPESNNCEPAPNILTVDHAPDHIASTTNSLFPTSNPLAIPHAQNNERQPEPVCGLTTRPRADSMAEPIHRVRLGTMNEVVSAQHHKRGAAGPKVAVMKRKLTLTSGPRYHTNTPSLRPSRSKCCSRAGPRHR